MVVPKTFRNQFEKVIASFDFFDLTTNIAFKNFFASVNNTNNLSPHQQDSNVLITSRSTDGTTEINFDYEFNLNMVVIGDFTIAYTQTGGAGTTSTIAHVDWRIIHVDVDNNETEMVATISGTAMASTNIQETRRIVVSGSIPRRNFQIREKIRLEARLIADIGSGAASSGLYHDPTSRANPQADEVTGLDPTTDLTFTVPFEVQP